MKKLRGNLFCKLLLALAVTASAFWLTFHAAAALLLYAGGYVGENIGYQDTNALHSLLNNYQNDSWDFLRLNSVSDTSGYSYLDQRQYNEALEQLKTKLNSKNTNFRYEIRTYDGTLVDSNLIAGQSWDRLGYSTALQREDGSLIFYDYGYFYSYDDIGYIYYPDLIADPESGFNAPAEGEGSGRPLILEFGLSADLTADDDFFQFSRQFAQNQNAFLPHVFTAILSALALLVALSLLLACAGHRSGREGICVGWFDRLWFDALVIAYGLGWCCVFAALWDFIFYRQGYFDPVNYSDSFPLLLWLSGAAALLTALALPLLYTFTVRCKSHTLLRSTLCHRLWRAVVWLWHWLGDLFHTLRLSWQLTACFLCYELVTLFLSLILWQSHSFYLILLPINLLLLVAVCRWMQFFQRVAEGGRALADGDLSYRINVDKMPRDLKTHAEHLNNISQGMSAAVEKQMQSERFKAELITNVSHDLKTPLTSIINYVDLLKKEEIDNPTAVEYIEVLDRKSQRLKKLTEDLVEASKASTGTLTTEKERIGLTQLVTQAVGEYEEKLAGNQLTLVTALPEEEVYVNADGRHLWRILDNLFSNCNKYALPGTRIYVDVVRWDGKVQLSVKNISRDPLNIPADQLMERFVRGDESRTTEGSGLGLSIARSLAELQGGQFRLAVDGDLFKATVILPEVK